MNRIDISAEKLFPSTAQSDLHDAYSVTMLRSSRSSRPFAEALSPHATYAPLHYEPGYAYPLIVWLHGSASNERQLRRIMPHVSLRNFVAVAPRGDADAASCRAEFDWHQTEDGIAAAESRILHCLAVAKDRFNIHDERVFLAGCESGGTMAMRVAWNNPGLFAGAATLGGPLPTQLCPLRRVNDLRQLPCLISTSRQSRSYPEGQVCRDLRLLHSAGCTVALRQYPGGDDLTTGMLSDLNHWVMELVCGAGATSSVAER